MDKIVYILSLLVIGLIPLEAITITEDIGISFGRIAFIGLSLCTVISYNSIKKLNYQHIICLLFFVIYAFISFFWSIDQYETLHRCLLLIQYLIITVIVTNVINQPQRVLWLIISFILGCLFISVNSVLDYGKFAYEATSNGVLYRESEFGNPNENAFMMTYSLVLLLLVNRFFKYKLLRVFTFIYSFIVVLAILTSGSRNGFIMLCLVIFSFLLMRISRFSINGLIFALISILLLGYISFRFLPEEMLLRYAGIHSEIQDGTMASRTVIWDNAKKMTSAEMSFNPLIGNGWGTFNSGYQKYTGTAKGSHNFYINMFYTMGVIGIGLLCYYFIILIRYLYKINDKNKLMYYLLIILPFISMITTNWESRKWWFIISIFIYKLYELNVIIINNKIQKCRK